MESFIASAQLAAIIYLKHVKCYKKVGSYDIVLPLIQKLFVAFYHLARHFIK